MTDSYAHTGGAKTAFPCPCTCTRVLTVVHIYARHSTTPWIALSCLEVGYSIKCVHTVFLAQVGTCCVGSRVCKTAPNLHYPLSPKHTRAHRATHSSTQPTGHRLSTRCTLLTSSCCAGCPCPCQTGRASPPRRPAGAGRPPPQVKASCQRTTRGACGAEAGQGRGQCAAHIGSRLVPMARTAPRGSTQPGASTAPYARSPALREQSN